MLSILLLFPCKTSHYSVSESIYLERKTFIKRLLLSAAALVALFTRAWRRSHPRGIDLNTLGSLRSNPMARPSSARASLKRRFRLWVSASALGRLRFVGFAYCVVPILYLVCPGPALAQSPH